MEPIVNFIFYIASPCLVFSTLVRSNVELDNFLVIVFSAAIITLILGLVSYIILKRANKIGLCLPMSIGNTGYIGYPIVLLAWGVDGLSKAVIFDSTAFIILLTLGIFIISKGNGSGRFREIIKAAPIYSIILGVAFNRLSINVPGIILTPIEMIGAITIPAALMVLGYRLSEIRIKETFMAALLSSMFKIFAGFLVAFAVVTLFGITGVTRNVIILLAAMPSAVMSMIICQKYKRDASLAASTVFMSTLISVITIPLVLWVLQ